MAAMGLSCCSKFAKCFLFMFNIVFWAVGAVVLGVGIWSLVDDDALKLMHVASVDTNEDLARGAAITLVVVGAIVFVTGFLGCCGAIKESPCMLMTYATVVGFVLGLQIVAGILGVVFKDKIEDELVNTMNKTVQHYYGLPGRASTTEAWDFMQVEFGCCGAVDGPTEWAHSEWGNLPSNNKTVPDTCCVLSGGDYKNPQPFDSAMCSKAATDHNVTSPEKYLHMKGCQPQLYDWVVDHAVVLIGIAFGLAVVQLACIIMGCALHCEVRNQGVYA